LKFQEAVGEDLWFSQEKGSEFTFLLYSPHTYRESWKICLAGTLQANTSFVDWIFEKLQPVNKKVANFVDMSVDTQKMFGDAELGCSYRRRMTVTVPRILYFQRTVADGNKGATFIPVHEHPEKVQTVHVCQGDYNKLLDIIKKKNASSGGVQIRLVYADPPWGFHSSRKDIRTEDEVCEPPESVMSIEIN